MSAPFRVWLFGNFEAQVHGRPFRRLRTRRGQWLLVLLVLRHGREVERSWLAGTLWPDSAESDALRSLRQTLVDLRHALGEEALRLTSPTARTLRLDLAGAEADVVAFDAAVSRGDAASLEEAITLYRGPLLEGWTEEWVFEERQAREHAYLAALERLASEALAAGDGTAAARFLRRATVADPLRERAHRALMEALAAGGEYTAATEVYRNLRLLLHREMNASPSPETSALFDAIRAEARQKAAAVQSREMPRAMSEVGVGAPRGIGTDSAEDLRALAADPGPPGMHPLPDTSPVLGPPGADLAVLTPTLLRSDLPQPLTPLLGREREVAEIESWLATARLVTLTGAGGIGKTRLAIQVARELVGDTLEAGPAFASAAFVDLAPLSDPDRVAQAVAATLGMLEQPGLPLADTLVAALRRRQLLLVLDNCEHLVAACAALSEALLAGCPELRILATSREALGLTGEVAWRVPSLSLPDLHETPSLETLTQYAGTRLFVERARAVQPRFVFTPRDAPAVLEVCHRLDGIPLAIELAAAWARALSVQQIAGRLADGFRLLTGNSHPTPVGNSSAPARARLSRQRTLRAAIQWSFDLLTGEEKVLLRRLSVFLGGWTLEAAEAVCSDCGMRIADCGIGETPAPGSTPFHLNNPQSAFHIPHSGVLDLLTHLIDKSLVQLEGGEVSEVRYRMLETVRQFAREQLEEAGEAPALQAGHRDFFLAFAEGAEAELSGPARRTWLDRLELEHDNLRTALDFGLRNSTTETRRHREERETRRDGRTEDENCVSTSGAFHPPTSDSVSWVLAPAGDLRGELPKNPQSSCLREAEAIRIPPCEATLRMATALWALWNVRGYWTEGHSWLERALSSSLAAPAARRAPALLRAGMLAFRAADYPAAARLYTASLDAYRATGHLTGSAGALYRLGLLAEARGAYEEARALLEESLATARASGDRRAIADALAGLGTVADMQGDYAAARPLYEESLGLMRVLGARAENIGLLIRTGHLLQSMGDPAAARRLQEEALAISREQGDRGGVAFALNCLGMARLTEREDAEAEPLFAEALAISRALGDERSVGWSLHNLGLVARARGDLDQAGALLREALAKRWATAELRGAAASLRALGHLERATGDECRAVRLWAAGCALPDAMGTPRSPSEQAELLRGAAEVRQRLGSEVYDREWEAGQGMAWEAAVAFALGSAHNRSVMEAP